jgi:hypothetical protein
MRKSIFILLIAWMLLPLLAGAQSIQMRIPDSTLTLGGTIDIPVYADNTLNGQNVLSYVLQLSYNQSYLQLISVFTAGTISAAFGSPAVNTTTPGVVTIAGAGSTSLSGSGKFIYLKFKAILAGSLAISFTGVQNNYFNEGLPLMTFDNGYITIPAPAVVTVSPNTGLITKGETLQFSASGGTVPYTWSVTNPAVALISPTGLLTGLQHGWTRVVAVSSQGLRDTTNGEIEIRPMKLSIPGNLSQLPGTTIDIPVNTTDLTGLGVISGNFSITFNQSVLIPVGILQTGTLLTAGNSVLFNISQPGKFMVDFAGTTPLAGAGILLYLRFQVATANSGGTALQFTDAIFNEDLIPNFTNGYFSIISLPVLSIAPATGTLVAGQSQQFTVNGGPALPVTWSVSDPAVASISATGLLTTIKGGLVTVTAVDANGATATSGNWLIYDTRVIMPDTTTCPSAQVAWYPIRITSLPAGQSVSSVQGTMTFSSTYLTFLEMVTTGSLTQGWTYFTNATASQVTFAGSGAIPFSGSGPIVYLKFQLKPAFVAGTTASLQLPSILLNEGTPNPLVDQNGSILGSNTILVPSVSIVASANPVGAGLAVNFTATPVNGGITPTYQWRVNGININGATNRVYTYTPSNLDQVSCVMTSSSLCVNPVQATSNTITMSVTGLPVNLAVTGTIVSPQTSCFNATQTITVAGSGTLFQVNNGASATLIAGQKIRILPTTIVSSGAYFHAYITTNGMFCNNAKSLIASATEELQINPEMNTDLSSDRFFKVFPNPTSGKITLELSSESIAAPVKVELFNLMGTLVMEKEFHSGSRHDFAIDDQKAGMYILRVNQGNENGMKKIIRE